MKVIDFVFLAIVILDCHQASAADITIVSSFGTRGYIEQVRQDFEHSTADRLNMVYDFAAKLGPRLDAGEHFDVVILTRSMVDHLVTQQRVVPETSMVFAKEGIGIVAKAGTAKPFMGTRDSMRRTLLASSRITYAKGAVIEGAAARLFRGLGITKQIKNRVYVDARPVAGVLAVAEGTAPLGIATLSEIAADRRVELVARVPDDLQTYLVFAAAMASGTKEPDACRAFIAFLRKPEERRKLQDVGLDIQ